MAPRSRPEDERFWDSVQIPVNIMSECWLWQRARDRDGYGLFKRGPEGKRQMVRAHRFAHALVRGVVSDDLQVLHSCNNPRCVNPVHLRAGTNSENMADRKAAGHYPLGLDHQNVTLSAEQVAAIRADPRAYVAIAAAYGTSKSTVYQIKSDTRHWSWRQS